MKRVVKCVRVATVTVVAVAVGTALLVLLGGGAAWAGTWPVGPPRPAVVRGWEPPATPYGRGHRGVDLAAPPGTEVRAAAAGRVSFAGAVAGRGVLSITLSGTGDPPLRTTYEPVRPLVRPGTEVAAGQVVAVVPEGPSHCPQGCLHWGLRRGDAYLDPLSLLPPSQLRRGLSRLLPVFGVPVPVPVAESESESEPGPAQGVEAVAAEAEAGAGAEPVQALALAVAAVWFHRVRRRTGERDDRGRGRRGQKDGSGADPPSASDGGAADSPLRE
ncbi:M23 family metallopeptidase [Streptomyces sp. NPDC001514]